MFKKMIVKEEIKGLFQTFGLEKKGMRSWVSKSNFLNPISLQPDGLNFWYLILYSYSLFEISKIRVCGNLSLFNIYYWQVIPGPKILFTINDWNPLASGDSKIKWGFLYFCTVQFNSVGTGQYIAQIKYQVVLQEKCCRYYSVSC